MNATGHGKWLLPDLIMYSGNANVKRKQNYEFSNLSAKRVLFVHIN